MIGVTAHLARLPARRIDEEAAHGLGAGREEVP
jgi:hypothetical protein